MSEKKKCVWIEFWLFSCTARFFNKKISFLFSLTSFFSSSCIKLTKKNLRNRPCSLYILYNTVATRLEALETKLSIIEKPLSNHRFYFLSLHLLLLLPFWSNIKRTIVIQHVLCVNRNIHCFWFIIIIVRLRTRIKKSNLYQMYNYLWYIW